MPKYRVEVTYDMGMSHGGETYQFEAKNDEEARKHVKECEGGDLSPIKRGLHFDIRTLSRVLPP